MDSPVEESGYERVSDPDLRRQLQTLDGVPLSAARQLHQLFLEREKPRFGYLARLRSSRLVIKWHDTSWGEPPAIKNIVLRCGDGSSLVYGPGGTVSIHGPEGYRQSVPHRSPIWVLVDWAIKAPLGQTW